MKKIVRIIAAFFVSFFLLAMFMLLALLIAAPMVNDHKAKKTADKLADLPLPDKTEYIEQAYKAGKLVGNGNGMQYFGAVLIKSELSAEELQEYYLRFATNDEDCVVEPQVSAEIKIIEHEQLRFNTDILGDNYYMVYSWGDNPTIFHSFDIRGH